MCFFFTVHNLISPAATVRQHNNKTQWHVSWGNITRTVRRAVTHSVINTHSQHVSHVDSDSANTCYAISWAPARASDPDASWALARWQSCLIGCCLAGSDRISTPLTAPRDCDKSPRNRRTKVNTAFVILLDADTEDDASLFNHRLLFLPTVTHRPSPAHLQPSPLTL